MLAIGHGYKCLPTIGHGHKCLPTILHTNVSKMFRQAILSNQNRIKSRMQKLSKMFSSKVDQTNDLFLRSLYLYVMSESFFIQIPNSNILGYF